MGRARDAILDALENLTVDEFKKFKMKLLSVPVREGYGRIPRGPLLQMDAIDLTDKLVSYYLETYGLELTMTVLRDMGMQELAEPLQKIMEGMSPCLSTLNFLHTRPASLALNFLFLLPYQKKNLPFVALNLARWVEWESTPKRLLIGERTTWHFFAESGTVAAATSVPVQSTARTGKASPPHHTLAQPFYCAKARARLD